MKQTIYTLTVFLFTVFTFSNSNSATIKLISFAQTRDLSVVAPCHAREDVSPGTLNCTVDGGPNVTCYCYELCKNINFGDTLNINDSASSYDFYIMNNYYPNVNNYPGRLSSVSSEAAAVQCAIWHLNSGLYIDSIRASGGGNSTIADSVRLRTAIIVSDALLNGGSTSNLVRFMSIVGDADPTKFIVKTADQNGDPIAVNNISLAISQGSLSTNLTSTDASGESAPIEVIGTANGVITAEATVTISQGTLFRDPLNVKQPLGLAIPATGIIRASAEWGALPVELSSFNANVTNRNVMLEWSTVSETNNSGFDIERKFANSQNWSKIGNVQGNGTSSVSHNYSFTDRNIATGKYNYRLKQTDFNGNYEYHSLNSEVTVGNPTNFELSQNYPNPFNPSTTINFDMPNDGFVSLKIFNTSGKEVATLVNDFKTSGYYSVNFNATNLSSGVYYYRLEANGLSKVMKMALIK